VDPTLKYSKGNIADGPWPSSSSNMPPERTPKRDDPLLLPSEKKKEERLALAVLIENMGSAAVPCSFCVENKRKCIVFNEKSSRCSECVRAKRSSEECDAEVSLPRTWDSEVPRSSTWVSIDRQVEQLDEEEERAAAAAQEAMARVARLRKQRTFLRERKKEMLRRGLSFLDELDAAEEKERLEKEKAERRVPDVPHDPSMVDPEVDPALLAAFADGSFLWDPNWGAGNVAAGSPSTLPGS
jgi:hypothetical protein